MTPMLIKHSRTPKKNSSPAVIILSLAVLVLLLTAVSINNDDSGLWPFTFALVAIICFAALLWFLVLDKAKGYWALKFAFIGLVVVQVFGVIALLSMPEFVSLSNREWFFVEQRPFRAALGGGIPLFCIILIVHFLEVFRPKEFDTKTEGFKEFFEYAGKPLEFLFIIAGVLNLLWWVALADFTNPIFYLVRVWEGTFEILPFFVGLLGFRMKKAFRFWLVVLSLQLGISVLTGTRGAAFFPLLYFLIGFLVGLPSWRLRFRWLVFLGGPLGIFLLFLGVLIGDIRDVTGRTDLFGAIEEGRGLDVYRDSTVTKSVSKEGSVLYRGANRLAKWQFNIVPAMTPDPIAFRGYYDIGSEIRSAFSLGVLSEGSVLGRRAYFANIFLRPYGFAVHVNAYGVKTSNVGLPVSVDGFMRGGFVGSAISCIIFFGLVAFTEKIIMSRSLGWDRVVKCVLFMFLCGFAFQKFQHGTIIEGLRYFALNGSFTILAAISFGLIVSRGRLKGTVINSLSKRGRLFR